MKFIALLLQLLVQLLSIVGIGLSIYFLYYLFTVVLPLFA